MTNSLDRRHFLQATGATIAAGYFVSSAPAQESQSPNERLNLAAVGATGRAGANVSAVSSQNIIAIADVDQQLLDKGAERYPRARKYRDYRVMLEKESNKIDAVLVGTPDHSHAPASAMALRLGKHVYCEKPLTHTVKEARVLTELAKANSAVTQMGTQIHAGDNYRRVVELIEFGAIGPVGEAHVWANAVYTGGKFTTGTPAPPHVDWDLWLGPAPERSYSEGVHPFHWRRFWDYGTGTLGDFGCHYMDLTHWALKLRAPVQIAAQGPPVDPVSTPAWCIVDYEFPARGDLPPVKLTWYDSGKRPEMLASLDPESLVDQSGRPMRFESGQLFVGRDGMLLSNYTQRCLLPAEKFADLTPPERTIPDSIGHHAEWLHAIKTGSDTTCNFDYAGALTETVMLGTVAYRSGKMIAWDTENLRVTNAPEAQQFVHKEYRPGWSL